jgi:uncharacterized protein with FMN-binding domain
MKTILIIVSAVLLIGVAGFVFGSIGLDDIKKMTINDVDLTKSTDGVYAGKFHKVRWNYEVEVTVKEHKIMAIKPTGKVDPGRNKIVDGATEAIISKQSVKIDAVSGATIDTKAFCKAVENALINATR